MSTTCVNCGRFLDPDTHACSFCGAPLEAASPLAGPPPAAAQGAWSQPGMGPLGWLPQQVYGKPPGLLPFQPEEHGAYASHRLEPFSTAAAIALHFVTFGLFTTIYYGIQHGNLPRIAHDDPSVGKAIGFLFIPFYNLYWIFFFWLRLCDRINLQLALRGLPPTAPRGLALATCIVMLVPYVGLVSWLVLMPILVANLQSSINQIVAYDQQVQAAGRLRMPG